MVMIGHKLRYSGFLRDILETEVGKKRGRELSKITFSFLSIILSKSYPCKKILFEDFEL